MVGSTYGSYVIFGRTTDDTVKITGTPGNDIIDRTVNADKIHALAGNDSIRGLAGADTINTDTFNTDTFGNFSFREVSMIEQTNSITEVRIIVAAEQYKFYDQKIRLSNNSITEIRILLTPNT